MKTYTKSEVKKNRERLGAFSFTFNFLGFLCFLLFASTDINYELPWYLVVIGLVFFTIGFTGFKILEVTSKKTATEVQVVKGRHES